MKCKTLFLTLIFGASILFAGVLQAQTPLTPQQKIEKRLAHLQKRLGLSDQQTAQLKTILEQNMAKLQADREAVENAAKGDAKKDAKKQLISDRKSMMDQLKGVLTPDQLAKFKKMRLMQIERREKRLERQKQRLQK